MTWIAGVIAILIGLVACFYGYRMFRVWLAVAGFIGGAYFGESLGRMALPGDVWPVILAIALGLVFALIAYFVYRLGVILTGAVLGAALVNLLFVSWSGIPAAWPVVIGAVLGAILASIFIKPYIIIGSSFNGAYLAVIGIYSIAVVRDLSKAQLLAPGGLPWYVLVGIFILTALGIMVQFGINKGRELGDIGKKKPPSGE